MRKRRMLIFSLATLILIFTTALLFWVKEKDSIFSIEFIVNDNQNEERISLHKEGDTFFAFLPAYANLEDVTISVNNGNRIYVDNKLFDRETNFSALKTDLIYTIEIKNFLGLTVNKEKLMILKSENIPTISLSLSNGTINDIDSSKSNKVGGVARVISEKGDKDYSGVFKSIHGRGRASWNSSKKSYTLEFEDNVNVLNLGDAKKWILLANAYDASNLKNKLIFEASKKLGMKYYCDSQFVDLYIDGDYRGLYLLSEKIEVGENRIDIENLEEKTQQINYKKLSSYGTIEKTNCANGCGFIRYYDIPNNPVDITGGYILKLEQPTQQDDTFFVTEKGTCFYFESPKYVTKEQIEYISDIMQRFENNVDDFDVLQQFVDIDSCVNRCLIEECFANREGTSYYFVKDSDKNNGKLYFEPVWDYDAALGNIKTTDPTGMYNTEGLFGNLINSNQAIQGLVKAKFAEKMLGIMNACEGEIQQYYQLIRASDAMNKIRWKNVYGESSSLDIKVDNLIDYINQRVEFLSKYWIEGEDYVTVIFSDPEKIAGSYHLSKSVIRGDTFGQVVDPLIENNHIFLGWFNEETGEEFDESKPILFDCKFIAKWQEKRADEANGLSLQSIKNDIKAVVKDFRKDKDTYYAYGILAVMLFCFLIVVVKDISDNRKKVKHK